MFYDVFYDYDLSGWFIAPMPSHVSSRRADLDKGAQHGWPYRTHNAVARFKCYKCKKTWISAYTTVVWRASWKTGRIEIRIEKQRCRQCETSCQGWLIDKDHIGFALDCMCLWILEYFFGIRNENDNEDQDELDEAEETTGPHDAQRCEAREKGTCKKCKEMKQHFNGFTYA